MKRKDKQGCESNSGNNLSILNWSSSFTFIFSSADLSVIFSISAIYPATGSINLLTKSANFSKT